ncbi:shikimate dehydrogenase [Clostridium formicaceticum]|uniref:Shikimate dehydrogenase (NADP(+)) n=1 Tax=Clostridium formicaceticum TaxID=1497 RepID=A0AAC9WG72_9CLOT|nr:shikimate dehydrogenase [Clostridium formicaceticum]AOY77041.1 shikimate dehydrogenase [Clostridium formicaceticum]ARE87541.1 Shikimate dehydrogenase [Clostridium formicaceticum]
MKGSINGKTKTICLLGNPVEHSFSPVIHNYGFDQQGINCVYVNHKVEDEDLKAAVEGMKALGYLGCNVTYPHKINIMNYLDELTEEARLIGAVNTVKNQNGRFVGYNTDGMGFVKGLLRKGIDLNGKKICMLGAGGAAKSIAVALAIHFDCSIAICNRRFESAIKILNVINNIKEAREEKHKYVAPEDLDTTKIDILINCTPVGMVPNEDVVPFEDRIEFHENLIVSDLIYHPFETALLKKAKKHGCKIHHGLDMLIDQGILAFEIWTGEKLEFESLKQLLWEIIYKQ